MCFSFYCFLYCKNIDKVFKSYFKIELGNSIGYSFVYCGLVLIQLKLIETKTMAYLGLPLIITAITGLAYLIF